MKDMLGQEITLRSYVLFPMDYQMKRGRIYSLGDNKVSILSENKKYIICIKECVIYNAIVSINPQLV